MISTPRNKENKAKRNMQKPQQPHSEKRSDTLPVEKPKMTYKEFLASIKEVERDKSDDRVTDHPLMIKPGKLARATDAVMSGFKYEEKLGRAVAAVARFLRRDHIPIQKYNDFIKHRIGLYEIVEKKFMYVDEQVEDVRPINMRVSKASSFTLVKFRVTRSPVVCGYAILEYATTIAMRMKTYDENRAHQIYNSLTYANLPVEQVFEYKADTMTLAQLMTMEFDLDRRHRIEEAIVAYDHAAQVGEKIATKKLRAAMFRYHIESRNYAKVGRLVLAAIGAIIISLIPFLSILIRKSKHEDIPTAPHHSPAYYPVVCPTGELCMEPVPQYIHNKQIYDLPYLEDEAYGTYGTIEKPQYAGTSVTYPALQEKKPTRHYLLGQVGYSLYYWDRHNPANYAAAAHGRLFVDNGPGLLEHTELIPYIEAEANRLADLLEPMDDSIDYLSVENRLRWIASRPYCAMRKAQMTARVLPSLDELSYQVSSNDIPKDGNHTRVEPFIKDEGYPMGNKPPRMICARDDLGKTIYGPLFQSLNDQVFHLPFATKHIPNADRPRYISERLYKEGDFVYVVTDMSAFECAMRSHLQEHCEMIVYKRIIPVAYHKYLDELLLPLTMRTRDGVCIRTPALRLSGEMNTSLGNTITNVISIETCAHYLGLPEGSYSYVCEGDDALLRLPRSVFYNKDDQYVDQWSPIMRNLGFNIKIENLGMPLGRAGYCSTYWDEDCNIVINPIKALMTFYIGNNHMPVEEQLRMKALNYAVSCPGEPILTALSAAYLNRTQCARMSWSSFYYEERGDSWHLKVDHNGDLITTWSPKITWPNLAQRQFFEDMYGVSVEEQLRIELLICRDPEAGVKLALEELGVPEEYAYRFDQAIRI